MTITPGAYLAARRRAAGLSVADVAARFVTEPRVAERDRIDWLERIEADVDSPTIATLSALHRLFNFDFRVLARLGITPADTVAPAPQLCRVCACSELDACILPDGATCGWASDDLCTACAATPGVAL